MKKLMFATLSLVCMFAVSSGGQTPSASAAPSPEIGSCRWFCGNNPTAFRTAAACSAACSSFCDKVC